MKRRIIIYISAIICLLGIVSCYHRDNIHDKDRQVLVFFQLGFNNLNRYLEGNINTLDQNWIPKNAAKENVILVFSKSTNREGDYTTQTEPVLYRLYANKKNGTIVRDTLRRWPIGTISATAQTITEVFNYVEEKFPANSYGALMSSHGSGWLPEKYYTNPELFKDEVAKYTFGAEYHPNHKREGAYEITIPELRAAIPIHLDYLLFDACLMGGIETAYELKDVASYIVFSQAEVLGDGLFNYNTLTTLLLKGEKPLLESICSDSFDMYNAQSGYNKSVTLSLVDCANLTQLAQTCAPLFEKYRQQILELDYRIVQGFGGKHHFFFDLVDIIRTAGATNEELAALQKVMDKCIVYKAHTGQYFSSSDNNIHTISDSTFSGLSMYLPAKGNNYLNSYYKSFSWNKEALLVK